MWREAQFAGVHWRGRVVQDAGRAEHLAVQLIDERQRAICVVAISDAQQRCARGALQEILQTPAAQGMPGRGGGGGGEGGGGGGRFWRRRGRGEAEGRGGRGGGGRVRVQVREGRVWIGFEVGGDL